MKNHPCNLALNSVVRAWVACLFFVVAALFLLVPNTANAQTSRKAKPAQVLSDSALTPGEAIKQGRSAMQRNDQARLLKLREATGAHALSPYIDYWVLRVGLIQSARSGQRDMALEDSAVAFMSKHSATVFADLLRRDLMLVFGRFGDWPKFEQANTQWILQDDKSVLCYAQLLKLKKTSQIDIESFNQLFNGNHFNEGCNTLSDNLAQLGQTQLGPIQANDWLARISAALFHGSASTARSLVIGVPSLNDRVSEAMWIKPSAGIAALRNDNEALTVLYLRWASLDFEAAAVALRAERNLNNYGLSLAWAQVAAIAARKADAQSHVYAQEAAKARGTKELRVLPDEVGSWALRGALRGSDWKSVLVLESALAGELRKDSTWVYWRAKAQKELGQPKEQWEKTFASIASQLGFYGQLAGEELGLLTSLVAPAEVAKLDATTQAVVSSAHVKRAREFYELGLRFEGNREWNWAIRSLSDTQLNAVARWADQQKLFDRAISTAERTVAQHDFAMRYIRPFAEPLTAAAKNHGLDPALVFGLIRQESRFIADVKSVVGAQGLMQLMPATARWVAKKLGTPNYEQELLNQVDVNLEFGSFYFRTVMENLDGNAALAAAAYNAGPGRPKQWRSTLPAKIEGAAFAETIPFHETRDYVKKVLSNSAYYGFLLTGQPQSLKARLAEVAPKVVVAADIP
jgi:soluble lytic murein transglycosylase